MGSRFSWVALGMEKLSSDLLRAVKNIVGCESFRNFLTASWCKVKIVWLYNLKVEQGMRNLACGDQWILLVVTRLVVRRTEIELIVYWQIGSCVAWPFFQGWLDLGWRRIWGYWNCNVPWFGKLLLGGSIVEKRGDNRKNKFFASNSVEALIPCNEENWGVMKLQVHLGWEWGRIKQRVKGGAISKRGDGGAGSCQ